MKCILLILGVSSLLVIGAEAHIFARFIRRWSYDDHDWDDAPHDEWHDHWHTKTKTIIRVKPVIKVKHIVKEVPVYKTVKVYKTIPVYKEVPVVKEVKVIKHIHIHKKEAENPVVPTKDWNQGNRADHVYFTGEAKHGPHDVVGTGHGTIVKDSASEDHHQWPSSTEDKDKIWSDKGWQLKQDPAASATHSTGGDFEQTPKEWKVEEDTASGKHWLPPQGWVPPEGWQPPPNWQPPSGWKEWVQKRKSSRKGTIPSGPMGTKRFSK